MQRFVLSVVCLVLVGGVVTSEKIGSGDGLVSKVLNDCYDLGCVKTKVLSYLDTILGIEEDGRNIKDMDAAIFKRMARVIKTHEFRFRLPEMLFSDSELVYHPRSGLDIASIGSESRDILKKKVLLPALLLLKLKMKALMPIFLGLIGLKAFKALILSKLAILLVVGFIIYTLCKKNGMAMPMMMPVEAPMPAYGAPATSSPSSYDPSWEPSSGGPYSRVWNNADSQSMAYSAYYPGSSSGPSSTTKP